MWRSHGNQQRYYLYSKYIICTHNILFVHTIYYLDSQYFTCTHNLWLFTAKAIVVCPFYLQSELVLKILQEIEKLGYVCFFLLQLWNYRWHYRNIAITLFKFCFFQYHCHALSVNGPLGVHLMLQEADTESDMWSDLVLMVAKNVQTLLKLPKVCWD